MSASSEHSLISGEHTFLLLAALFSIIAVSAVLERTRIGRRLSAPAIIILLAITGSHFHILPRSSGVFNVIWAYLVPLSIALFLLKADLIGIVRDGGRVLAAFLIGLLGVCAGAALGAALLDLGPMEAELVAVFSATYTGGSLNFAAVAEAVEFKDQSELAAALAIDNVLGTLYILLINLLASWSVVHNRFDWRSTQFRMIVGETDIASTNSANLPDLSIALAIATSVCAFGLWAAIQTGLESYSILFTTSFMVLVATLGRSYLRDIKGEDLLAMMFMYLFFAMIGAGADINAMLQSAPPVFVLVLLILAMHVLFMFIAGHVLKLNYREMIIASAACITGPPLAAAIAILFNWRTLTLPGIATGVFGYVVGNFVGLGAFTMLQGF